MEEDIIIGDRIRKIREDLKMSREEMRIQFAMIKELEKSESELVKFYGLPQIKREVRKQIKPNPWLDGDDFIYKKTFHIKTKYSENDYTIISKSYNYLLTIDGSRIYIKDIIDIY